MHIADRKNILIRIQFKNRWVFIPITSNVGAACTLEKLVSKSAIAQSSQTAKTFISSLINKRFNHPSCLIRMFILAAPEGVQNIFGERIDQPPLSGPGGMLV
jgi:hypothetical protein